MRSVGISASAALQRILHWCHQWNGAHPWDHNSHYHRWVLRQLPMSFDTALDVGCGTGDLARTLRTRSLYVHGVDIDERSVTAARHLTAATSDIEFSVVDAMDLPQSRQYDVITALAVVHHMPLAPVLRHLRDALAPGGTLVVLGCYQEATRTDRLLSILAIPANVLIGGMRGLRRPVTKHPPMSVTAPTAPATNTLAEIRRVAAREVPDSTIRRHLFWRYSLVFRAPRA
jgi:SAM-dependent methyltransferase